MWQNEQNHSREEEPNVHRTVYKISGKLLNYVIKVWVGLMIGITLTRLSQISGDLYFWGAADGDLLGF